MALLLRRFLAKHQWLIDVIVPADIREIVTNCMNVATLESAGRVRRTVRLQRMGSLVVVLAD